MPAAPESPLQQELSRVLVTGAGGFTGLALARNLAGLGYRVRGLVRNPAGAEELSRAGVEVLTGDVRDEARLLSLLYPLLRLTAATDRLLPWQPGHKLIIRATLQPGRDCHHNRHAPGAT